jgi:hypothetical protein
MDRSPPRSTRRAALATLVAGGALVTFRPSAASAQDDRLNPSDVDLLNFVLNLEYLKAEFYGYGATGKGLDDANVDTSGVGKSGATVGGSRVSLHGKLLTKTMLELARDEAQHVTWLRSILGRDAVAKPLIDLGGLGTGFKNMSQFLAVARALEDTSVSAYAGIVPLVQGKETLATATRFLASEAQHAGTIRLLSGLKGVEMKSLDAKDVVPPPAGNNIFSSDKSGLATTRSPAEVLAIVKPFFPRGVNGTLN